MTKKEKLVDLLRQDARLSNEQLAAMLDTSADDVAAMIAELEKSGMIIGYTVTIKGTNLRDVAMFVTDRLAPLGGVLSTTTHFILHRYKEKDKMFLKNTDERSLVSP